MMPSVFDVAQYILDKCGPMSTMKLQKLVYYAQAWSLVREGDVLFEDEIEAWANGPVVPALFHAHRGNYRIGPDFFTNANPDVFTRDQRKTLNLVIRFYGVKSGQWLSDLTHAEDPWKEARVGMSDGDRGDQVISKESLLNYYSSL